MGMLQLLSDQDFHPQRELFSAGEIGVIGDIADMNRTKLNWRRNLLTYTEDFSNAVWAKQGLGTGGIAPTVTANSATAPDGTTTADTITFSIKAGAATNRIIQTTTASTASRQFTGSVWLKVSSGTASISIYVDDSVTGGPYGGASTKTVTVTTSWQRFDLSVQFTPTETGFVRLSLVQDSAATTSAFDLYAWGAQLELGSTPSEYQPILDGATNFKLAFPNHALYQDSTGVTPVTAVGDLVGLVIDKSQGGLDALGAELVTNGDFATGDLTGWTATGSAVVAYVDGAASVTRVVDAADRLSHQLSATLVAGEFYRISFTVVSGASSVVFSIRCGTTSAAFNCFTFTAPATVADGTRYSCVVQIASGATNPYISFASNSNGVALVLDDISFKKIPGHSIYQSTSGSRPSLSRVPFGGRRNLLNESERFDASSWVNAGTTSSVTANQAANPLNGETTADAITITDVVNSRIQHVNQSIQPNTTYTISCYLKNNGMTTGQTFDFRVSNFLSNPDQVIASARVSMADGTASDVSAGSGISGSPTIVMADEGNGWYRLSITFTTGSITGVTTGGVQFLRTANQATFFAFGAQLELGSTATNYQRTAIAGTVVDCTESGVPDCWYLDTSSNKWMQTAAIDFSATDEMTVIAGVRKLSDAASAVVYELTNGAGNYRFALRAPDGAASNYTYISVGTSATSAAGTYTAPTTNVISGLSDISLDVCDIRVDGVVKSQSTADQGSGTYANDILYIGARAGSSFYFNGHIFYLLVRGKTTSGSKLTRAEKYIAKKTGLTI